MPLATDFKIFHELMRHRVHEILLVSSPYDAFILEEDGSLASRIINEYHGLNLSQPPRLTRVATGQEGLALLRKKKYDLVITMPFVGDMDAATLAAKIKMAKPKLPIILLAANLAAVCRSEGQFVCQGVDNLYLWSGSSDLFLAIIKNVEDHLNISHDTKTAMVRVLIMVEDSPVFRSSILPIIYRGIVGQTQAVLAESLNPAHRILKMRARPKILLAASYEEAIKLYKRYRKYVFGVVSDTSYPKGNKVDDDAGIKLLSYIRKRAPDLPLLLLSANPLNRDRGEDIPAVFLDKNSPDLLDEVDRFLVDHLGFGDFVFRMPDGAEVGRAANFRTFQDELARIPVESLLFHATKNHFSTWVMARSEIELASSMSRMTVDDFATAEELRTYLISTIRSLRKWRQRGVVAFFQGDDFDPNVMDFVKIGEGSMGGKARGLAFMGNLLRHNQEIYQRFPEVSIRIPKTCVISEEGFSDFVEKNALYYLCGGEDHIIARRFSQAPLPDWLRLKLRQFLTRVRYPLAIRSSSLREDAQYRPYAGLYTTYMLPNDHADFKVRLHQLETAIKLVYSSTYFEGPRAFARNVVKAGSDAMAVIIQELTGRVQGPYFYPAISGVAQSHNFYPISHMRAVDGIAHISVGFGRTVVEGETCLHFSPMHPKIIPQFASVDDTMKNAQRYFYALDRRRQEDGHLFVENLSRREISDAAGEEAVDMLTSAYLPEEQRIRDGAGKGYPVVTFARVLKYDLFPLSDILATFLEMGRQGMGSEVEIEFSANLPTGDARAEFDFLQIRPMVAGAERSEVTISARERKEAFCVAGQALGHGLHDTFCDILFVRPQTFSTRQTVAIAREVAALNAKLGREQRRYLLIGPGRWGSADRFLGIPVQWQDIASVGAIIEVRGDALRADPSQGTHFFQNITSLGIPYITVDQDGETKDRLDWQWLAGQPLVEEKEFMVHVRLPNPCIIKINARKSECVVVAR